MMSAVIQIYPKGISKACRILSTSRSSMNYQSIKDDSGIEQKLIEHSKQFPREGFWKCYYRMRNAGEPTNHKRLHRIYQKLELPLRRKVKKRLPARVKEPLEVPHYPAHTWSIDFTSDVLTNGIKFRSFNVIDDYNREILYIESDYSIKSSRVIWILKHLIQRHGKPHKIRMDNGPEFIAKLTKLFSEMHEIDFKYIQPGKPTQNAYIERFNRTYREAVLDAYLFDSIDEVREINQEFIHDYNHYRPHDSLQGMSPIMWKYGQKTLAKAAHFLPTLPHDSSNKNIENDYLIKKSTFELY